MLYFKVKEICFITYLIFIPKGDILFIILGTFSQIFYAYIYSRVSVSNWETVTASEGRKVKYACATSEIVLFLD